ncbi:hypothetical protein DVH05_019416 [Phytophthora capsici]|nr:hypothetical protein DVH05_019416 [Phytophthora capsici]
MTPTKIIKSGEATFKNWNESFHFVISTNEEGKLDILLEGAKSRKQWCTGYLAMDEYVADRSKIADVGVKSYVMLFHEILGYSDDGSSDADDNNPDADDNNSDDSDADDANSDDSDSDDEGFFSGKTVRTLLTLEDGALLLDLSLKFSLVFGGSWAVNYKFHLESISLERIRALEAKLRVFEGNSSKHLVRTTEESDGLVVDEDSGLVHLKSWNPLRTSLD